MGRKKKKNKRPFKHKFNVINKWDEKFDRDTILYDLGFKNYASYIASDLWRKDIRPKVKKKYEGVCQSCKIKMQGNGVPQVVHHRKYTEANMSGESLDGLMLVCKKCHDNAHQINFAGTKYIRSLAETNDELDRPKQPRTEQIKKSTGNTRPTIPEEKLKTKGSPYGRVIAYRQWKRLGRAECRVVGCDRRVGRRNKAKKSICRICREKAKPELKKRKKQTLEHRKTLKMVSCEGCDIQILNNKYLCKGCVRKFQEEYEENMEAKLQGVVSEDFIKYEFMIVEKNNKRNTKVFT
tara:strand:- start:82 stop:963 length:882 start_codon:yes stop_codon:yes gene_type:complete